MYNVDDWFTELCQLIGFYMMGTIIKRQPRKMVRYTRTIRRQHPGNCLNVFDHFVGLALKGLIDE